MFDSLLEHAKRQILTNPVLRRVFRERIQWSDGSKLVACLLSNRIDLVVDVGANVGQTHELLRLYGYTGDILSIEPLSAAHSILQRKAQADPSWHIAPRMAIGAHVGTAEINVSRASDLSSLLPATPTLSETYPGSAVVYTEDVEVHTLDQVLADYWSQYQSIFVKVDTQGFEESVLDGASESLRRLRGIQLELSLIPLYGGESNYLIMLERLARMDFEPHLLLETNFSFHLRRQVQFDVVAFRPNSPSYPSPSSPAGRDVS